MNEPGTDIARYADKAMYRAVPTSEAGEDVTPKAYLLSATPDPLGAMAAASLMYQGKPIRDVRDVTDDQRIWFFEDIKKTRLDSPFEFIDLHFMIEGVTRAFTHQMVRQRTAVYVQESQRFAVKDNGSSEVGLPPSLVGTVPAPGGYDEGDEHKNQHMRNEWDSALTSVTDAYNKLIDLGMPAEDARGLLPTNITTRIHYKTNLRALIGHAGNRLCTQAQFEWRIVWTQMIQAMRFYSTEPDNSPVGVESANRYCDNWQWELIADMFRPICYQTGKCEFMSAMDRHCNIRDRVQANHEIGRPSSEWHQEKIIMRAVGDHREMLETGRIAPIKPGEWLLDPAAARTRA